jgi:hypothetical protein
VFALRVAMASRITVDGFWLPMARSIGVSMGYGVPWGGAGAATRTRTPPFAGWATLPTTGRDAGRQPSGTRAHDRTGFDAPPANLVQLFGDRPAAGTHS